MRNSERTDLLTCLLEGPSGSGKTAMAATLGIESDFPFVKVVSSSQMMGFSESAKASQITKTIEDAYRVRFLLTALPLSEVFFTGINNIHYVHP